MATQRRVAKEKPEDLAPAIGLKPGGDPGTSNIKPAVPAPVIYKLLGFTAAIFALPIASYFATVDLLFAGNSTYAGALAAVVANVVLIGYIVVAMAEDAEDRKEDELKAKRQLAGPRGVESKKAQ